MESRPSAASLSTGPKTSCAAVFWRSWCDGRRRADRPARCLRPLAIDEFELSGTVGGLKCVIGIFDHEFYKVTGNPDPNVYRTDRQKAIHFGRVP